MEKKTGRSPLRIEVRGLLAAILAGLLVVGAPYGLCLVLGARGAGPSAKDTPMKDTPMKDTSIKGVPIKNAGTTNEGKGVTSRGNPAQAALVTTGRTLFGTTCASCHGASARGAFGPSLYNLGLPDARVAAVIKNGVKGKMPAYGGKYDRAHIQALVAFVQSLKK